MEIKIEEKGSFNYYDEFLFVINNYKKIYSNPNIKISRLTLSGYKYLIISIIFLIIFILLYLNYKKVIQLCIIILFSLLVIGSIIYIILIKRNIFKITNLHTLTIFKINNDYISLENKNQNYKLKFDDIKYIIFANYSIIFISKNIKDKFITLRIEYKDDIEKILKKYHKDDLIINKI